MVAILDRDIDNIVFELPELDGVLCLSGLPGGGSKIYDRSSYGNHGTITGATWVRTSGGLWCLSFDGTDDSVSVIDHASLDITGAFTLEAWVLFNTSGSITEMIFDKYYNSAYDLALYSTGNFIFRAKPGGVLKEVYEDFSVANDTFYHMVGTYDGANMKGFVNGSQLGSGVAATGALATNNNNLILGRNYSLAGNPLDGKIALARIYNRALSALEIQSHFNREKHLFGVW